MSVISKKTCRKFQYVAVSNLKTCMVIEKLKRQCHYSFAVFRSSLVEKPNLVLVSKYSTILRNQKAKSKEFFREKLSILTLEELLEYITSKHENVGNFLLFLLRFHLLHSDLNITKFEFNVVTKYM